LVESQLAAMMSKQGNPDFTNERVNARLDALETRIRSTGSQLVDLKNGDEDLRSSYDQRADKLLTRLAEQDRTIASLSKQLARNTARLDQVDESVQSRQASSDINAEQHLSSMTAAANAQHTQRFEMVQRALQSCAQRCDRVESEMHAQIAPRVTACVQVCCYLSVQSTSATMFFHYILFFRRLSTLSTLDCVPRSRQPLPILLLAWNSKPLFARFWNNFRAKWRRP
jgi:hypothetical protein